MGAAQHPGDGDEGTALTSATTWRRLELKTGPAEALLDEGVALLDSQAQHPQPTLRWYRPTDAALVLGRGQRADLFDASELQVLGRFSGGGAVLLDGGMLSLDVIVPAGHPLLDGELSAPFERIGQAWARALTGLGVPGVAVHRGPSTTPRKVSDRDRLLAAICYATLGRGEVTSTDRKIVGLAQRRRRHGALIQCGLLRRWQPGALLRALGANAEDEQILTAAVGLDELMAAPPSDEQIMAAVDRALTG